MGFCLHFCIFAPRIMAEHINIGNQSAFDDIGNKKATPEDVSTILLRDYLTETNNPLAHEIESLSLMQVLERMNLLDISPGQTLIKNVALLMFSYHPERFFPATQINVTLYPQGTGNIEHKQFNGAVHIALRNVLDYLKYMVVRKYIHKPKDEAHSIVVYNYPYTFIEQCLVNVCLCNNYEMPIPMEVIIYPEYIEIISSGESSKQVNPRLREFFKELHLTNNTEFDIKGINQQQKNNGSPNIIIEANNAQQNIIRIPCHI